MFGYLFKKFIFQFRDYFKLEKQRREYNNPSSSNKEYYDTSDSNYNDFMQHVCYCLEPRRDPAWSTLIHELDEFGDITFIT
jgi:hypothetical protein